jgi:hypothetical protein
MNQVDLTLNTIQLLAKEIALQLKGKSEKLMNLKQLSVELGIPYGTLSKKSGTLPSYEYTGRKLYKPSEVSKALSLNR